MLSEVAAPQWVRPWDATRKLCAGRWGIWMSGGVLEDE